MSPTTAVALYERWDQTKRRTTVDRRFVSLGSGTRFSIIDHLVGDGAYSGDVHATNCTTIMLLRLIFMAKCSFIRTDWCGHPLTIRNCRGLFCLAWTWIIKDHSTHSVGQRLFCESTQYEHLEWYWKVNKITYANDFYRAAWNADAV